MNIVGIQLFTVSWVIPTPGKEVTVECLQSEIKSPMYLDWFVLLGCGLFGFSSCFMVNCTGLCFLLNHEPLIAATSLCFPGISPPSSLPPSPSTFMLFCTWNRALKWRAVVDGLMLWIPNIYIRILKEITEEVQSKRYHCLSEFGHFLEETKSQKSSVSLKT